MPRKWKDLLTDKNIPDDFAISVNGETLTFGQMREYDRENEGALTQRLTAKEQEIAKREKAVNDASIQLATVIEKTAAQAGLSVDDFLSGKSPVKRSAVADAADLDENDPLVGKLVKELKGLRAETAKLHGDIDNVRKSALGPMLNTYLEDYYETKWEKLSPSLPDGSKLTLKEAMEHANSNGLKDSKGRLDLAKAARDLTYDQRVQAEAKKLATAERKKMEDEMALAAVPRPNQLGQRVKTDHSLQKQAPNGRWETKSFDDVLNDAVNDADLWKGIASGGNA
jgi:hypothetical protein